VLPRFSRLVEYALWLFAAATCSPIPGQTSLTCAVIANVLKLCIANWRQWVCNGFTLVLITVLTSKPRPAYSLWHSLTSGYLAITVTLVIKYCLHSIDMMASQQILQ